MRIQVFMIILVLFIPGVSAQHLSNIDSNLPANTNSILLSADINNDGLMDVFVSGINAGTRKAGFYKNKGDSTFLDLGIGVSPLQDAAACFADLNNDGWLDLVYTGVNSSNDKIFHIYINQKNNLFNLQSNTITGIRYGSVACADFNNDGWIDIFITGYADSGTTCKIYKNNGDLSFSPQAQSFKGIIDGDVEVADFNNDCFPDIIYSGYHSVTYKPVFLYYTNEGNFTFSSKLNSVAATMNGDIDISDIDNDGYVDILISGKKQDGSLICHAYKNNSGAAFVYHSEVTGNLYGTVQAGDFNMDGYTDLFVSGEIESGDNTTELYLNNGSGIFILETDTLTAVKNSAMNWTDFNNDNSLDILYAGNSFAQAEIFLLSSNKPVSNTIPQTPASIQTRVSPENDSVYFSWNKSTDTETGSPGLSYDFYVFNANTGIPLFYPAVDVSSGKRKLNKQGASKDTCFTITGLEDGKYIWSVQSVDAAFAGSPFAIADTFYISTPIDLGKNTALCYGDTITLSLANVEGSVEWYHLANPATPIGTSKEIKVEILQQETIWAVVTKDYGDKITDTIMVDMNPLPVVDLGDDFAVCYGDQVSLSLGTETDTVNWHTGSGLYKDKNSADFIHNFYSNDTIFATITDIHTCKNADTVLLTVRPLPVMDMVNDTALCKNHTLELDIGTASDSVNWYSLTTANEIINSNHFEFNTAYSDTFQIEFYDEYRCVNYDTINVYARSHPVADAGTDKLICAGYDVEIGPGTIMNTWSYQWSGDGEISNPSIANPVVHPDLETKFFLTVTDQFGCTGNDSMMVKINPIGKLDIGEDKEICIGDSVMLGGNPTAEGSIFPYGYQWNPASSLDNAFSANPVAAPKETSYYSLIVFTANCPVDTLNVLVTVHPLPVIKIVNDTLVGFKEDMPLWATGGVDYKWTPVDVLDNPYTSNPVANVQKETHFTVEVTDENNCKDTAGVTLSVINEIFIPDLFTPNNDLSNDLFKIYGIGIDEIELLIYNSEGLEVFYSKDREQILNTGWDGKFNGSDAKEGNYFWKISGTYFNGEEILFKGKKSGVVSLLR